MDTSGQKKRRNRNHWKRKTKAATAPLEPQPKKPRADESNEMNDISNQAQEILQQQANNGNKHNQSENGNKNHQGNKKYRQVGNKNIDSQDGSKKQRESSNESVVHLSEVSFKSLAISDESAHAIADVMKYELMTKVQKETLPAILDGKDVLAKSKTGTGKTMAFLLPIVECLKKTPRVGNEISALILSPTRELASQIEAEAKKLTTFHQEIIVACMVGGTSLNRDIRKLQRAIDILVGTPGRLQDHLKSNNENIKERIHQVKVLVLDEADRLLDMGFRNDIERILSYLPKERQTLLFSATLPDALKDVKRLALKKDHEYIDTVGQEDQTNTHVNQTVITCPFDQHVTVLETLLQHHIKMASDGYKIIVFFPTARAAGFMASIFLAAGFPILEMHSRKSQSYRTRTAETFRQKDNLIMFSSDVSARGVDYPGVSFVIQVGLTDREQYIHRLGRTGRAGKNGEGVLLLCEFENCLLKELADMPMTTQQVPDTTPDLKILPVLKRLNKDKELKKAGEQAYQAWLGFYNSNLKRLKMSKPTLISMAEEYSKIIGLEEVPALQKKVIGKMGLQNLGLRVQSNPQKK
ncbi:DEAD/DEAH box RNA helicase [Thraustotheca clavata]|uniref:ATP-dependent RNA helicase n=1 Tax=Thraustotheca clavata TaxID=74557 RepID=A0A1W0A6P7_9STRA|nr:DEAD/DEAH box RNA helicase [Thraustotheca clavata]